MSIPEERIRERERITISAAPLPYALASSEVSWPAVFAGLVVALGTLVLLATLGVAAGLTVLALRPETAADATGWTLAAGLWSLVSFLVALYAGGRVATRSGHVVARPAVGVSGMLVWVLTLIAVMSFGAGRVPLGTMLPLPPTFAGTAETAGPPNLAGAAPQLVAALDSGSIDRIVFQLNDATTADRLAAAFGLPRDRVLATLTEVRARVEANRGTPGRAVDEARAALEQLATGARGTPAGAVSPSVDTAHMIAGWLTVAMLLASLGAAVAGASAGARRPETSSRVGW